MARGAATGLAHGHATDAQALTMAAGALDAQATTRQALAAHDPATLAADQAWHAAEARKALRVAGDLQPRHVGLAYWQAVARRHDLAAKLLAAALGDAQPAEEMTDDAR
jgi:hypothetical protein